MVTSTESRHVGEPLIAVAVLLLAGAELVLRNLLVQLLALVLACLPTRRHPAIPAQKGQFMVIPAAPPTAHPLAAVDAELEELTAAQLRAMAGTRSKRHRKAVLIADMVALA